MRGQQFQVEINFIAERLAAIPAKFDRQCRTGRIKIVPVDPVVDRKFSLDEIIDAYRFVETAQKTGIVVIRVATAKPGNV